MARNPLASHDRAANPSRRELLSGVAATPFIATPAIAPDTSIWTKIVSNYADAHRGYQTFIHSFLKPGYAAFSEGVWHLPPSPFAQNNSQRPRQTLIKVRAAERAIVAAGGTRANILRFRADNGRHAALRHALAQHMHLRRARQRLYRRHRIRELEDQAGDLLAVREEALLRLVRTSAPDRDGALLKLRVSYEIFREDDHEGLIKKIFADIERLWV